MDHRLGVKRCFALAGAAAALAAAAPAWAAPAGQVDFHVAAGTLDSVLTGIAAQAGRRITFDPASVRGRSGRAVNGVMAPESAIRGVLEGTGMTLRTTRDGQWMVVTLPVPPGTGGRMLSTVRVTAAGAGAAAGGMSAGANGSSDAIATEGTKSYTTTGTIVASKEPLALKETPQAVSVLTRQQLDDRTITSFTESLNALAGVTATQNGLDTQFFSRGFQINNVQIDGGSPIAVGSTTTGNFGSDYQVLDDLSIYDSVAIQRGAAGTFTGVGSPGGAISLERKRPLDHVALEATVQGGSWDRLRSVLDASSPVLLDGLVKVRAVLTAERNDFFYDYATRRFAQAYLNVEVAPADGTTINLGGKIGRNRNTPFRGLPTASDGSLLDLPRDTCLCTSWSRSTTKTREAFAQLRQAIGEDWTVRLNGTATLQDGNDNAFIFNPLFKRVGTMPGVRNSGLINAYRALRRSDQYLLDGYVNGKFDLLGIGMELTAGGNYQSIDQKITDLTGTFEYDDFIVIPFVERDFPQPARSQYQLAGAVFYPSRTQKQSGAYATLRISPTNWIHLTLAERYSKYKSEVVSATYLSETTPPLTSRNAASFDNWSAPNVSLLIDVSKAVSAYANYNTIFDQYNLYQSDGQLVKPITGVNLETGMKQVLGGGKLNLSQNVFYIESRNNPLVDINAESSLNELNGSGCCYLTDGSKTISKGVEVQVQGAVTRTASIDASYTFTDIDQKNGPVAQQQTVVPLLQNIPRHLAKLWAIWQPPVLDKRLSIGLGGHVESSVISYVQIYGKTINYVYTRRGGYATADAMLRYDLDPRLSVQANVTNLFDRTYYSTVQTSIGNFYGQPRAFLLTLRGTL